MDKQVFKGLALTAAALVAAGCSQPGDTVPPETKAAKTEAVKTPPPEPVPAQSAFNQMYRPARQWAPDAIPLSLAGSEIPGLKNEGGKAGVWTAVFVSPSRREARTMFYSVAEHGSTHRGVTVGGAQAWSGATRDSKPFDATEFLVDSDTAYQTVYEKAEAWVKKNPDKKVSLYLASASQDDTPVWIVMWGDKKSGYLGFVNAATGKIMPKR
jgi:hypothetical protein